MNVRALKERVPADRLCALVLAAARDPSFCKSVHAKALAHFAGKHQKEKRDHRGEGRVLVKLVERSFEYYETSMREAQKHGRPEAARGVAVCIAVPFIKQLSYLPALQDLTDLAPRHTSPESFTRATGLATETIAKAILAERNPDPAKVARLVLLKLKCPNRTAEDVCPSKKKSAPFSGVSGSERKPTSTGPVSSSRSTTAQVSR